MARPSSAPRRLPALRLPQLGLALALAPSLAACSMAGIGGYSATAGGSQDIRLARQTIENGRVPRSDSFTAEGLFSEHDIETPAGPACAELLCPRASVAHLTPVPSALDEQPASEQLVHLGFAANIPVSFERPAVNLTVAVDVSGSMSGSKMSSVKSALHELVDQLDEGDRLGLVKFNGSARVLTKPLLMGEAGRATLHAKIDKLEAGGGTDIEAGMRKGYDAIRTFADGRGGREDRLMLFTDAQPNIGATGTSEFISLAAAAAGEGIGLSVFGVGLDLGAELAREVSELHGGNSFFLADDEAIEAVFHDDFDTIVTPLAYDLHFDFDPEPGFALTEVYGTPSASESAAPVIVDTVDVEIATMFLSKRGGAIAVVLDGPLELGEGDIEQALGRFNLDYETAAGEQISQSFTAVWRGGEIVLDGVEADARGGAKLAALLTEYRALLAGHSYCIGGLSAADAAAQVSAAAARLDEAATVLDDEALEAEADLMWTLADNLSGPDPRCA